MAAKKNETAQPSASSRKPSNSRGAILNAAIALFGRRGIDSVTIRDLEESSGVAAPTIYHFFGDKRSLYDQAIRTAFEKIERELFTNVDGIGDASELFRTLCRNYLRVFSRNTMFTRIFLQELHREDHALKRSLTHDRFVPTVLRWRDVLNRLVPGAGDGQLPLVIFSSLIGIGVIASVRKLAPPMPTKPGSAEENDAIVETLLALVLRSTVPIPDPG